MKIDAASAAELLMKADNIVILTHERPDGDTLGSGFALLRALEQFGKTARVENSDSFPHLYDFICGGYRPAQFEPRFVLSVDVAGPDLLGKLGPVYAGRIDLCIDHHRINALGAKYELIDSSAPAATQILYDVLTCMGAKITQGIADALFTGLTTDTGCFRYDNVNPDTHRLAAALIDCGADHGTINRLMFDTKTRGRLEIEKLMLNSLEYYFEGRCALVNIPVEAVQRFSVSDTDLDGISSFPRKIEGVVAGVTMREGSDGVYRISLRTTGDVDASAICGRMGGGGHMSAAGCSLPGPLEDAKRVFLREIERALP